jgi:DNA-binding CsgD family transcriptional regulator
MPMENAEFLHRLKTCVDRSLTYDEVFRFLHEAISEIGFKHIVYYLPKIRHAPSDGPIKYLSYSTEWISRYESERYLDIDPVVRVSFKSLTPVDWAELDLKPKRVQALFSEARSAGVGTHGMTIALRDEKMNIALLSVTSDATMAEWLHLTRQHAELLRKIGSLVHEKCLTISRNRASFSPNLSMRELECTILCARGLRDQGIADTLGISLPVTRGYLDSARNKLGALTRPHLISQAIKFGIILEETL